ncbi:uncharacterized protein LOC134501019 isoform X3 [Candoia aspera]|uniref:uncharacterized protein LOC134501019 isoform X3 n=1 Tax=Candoia aspera TaxID=51853 RepID=UPI002FD80C08
MTLLSPSSPGKPSKMMWEPNLGISRETSFCAAQLCAPSWEDNVHSSVTSPRDSLSLEKATDWPLPGEPNQKAISHFHGDAAEERLVAEGVDGQLQLPPHPPSREKAFIWLSPQEKKEALQRLAETQAEGARRRQCDKERQILRDEAGQKMAVKCHLEKVKRERTYVMQSKRERNTLKFKELLDPLVAPREESPVPRQTEELQPRGDL